MTRFLFSMTCAATVLTACETAEVGKNKLGAEAPSLYQTRVFMGPCVMAPNAESGAAVFGSLVSSVVGNGLNFIGNALQAAAKEDVHTITSTGAFEMGGGYFPPCIQVVRGQFATGFMDQDAMATLWGTDDTDAYSAKIPKMAEAGIFLTERPEFLFEGNFVSSTSQPEAYKLVPTFIGMEKPAKSQLLAGDTRHVDLTFAFHGPAVAFDKATNPGTVLSLGEIEGGQSVLIDTTPVIYNTTTPPFSRYPFESPWFKVASGGTISQMSATVAVTETRSANAQLAFLSQVFSDVQGDLKSTLEVRLNSEKAEAERLANLKAEADLLNAASVAFGAAITALDACASNGTAAKTADAQGKQRTANVTAEAAGQTAPFAVVVDVAAQASTNAATCRAALASL